MSDKLSDRQGVEHSGVGQVVLKKILAISAAVTGTLVMGLAGFFLTQDLSRFVSNIGDQLSAQTGQTITIKGPIRVGLAFDDALWISLEDISVRPTGAEAYTASIEKLRVRVSLLPLLRREILTEVMEITGGRFLAQSGVSLADAFHELPGTRGPRSHGDWTLAGFRRLQINRSFVGVVDGGREAFAFPISNFSAEPGTTGLALSLKGKIEGRDVVFEGSSGPWAALLKGHRVYLDGTISSESLSLAINGSIGDPSTYGLELLVRGAAEDLGDVAALAGFSELERTSSMSVALHARVTTRAISVRDIDLKYGRGDLSGWFEVKLGERIDVDGALAADFLDLEAFEGGHFLHPPTKLFPDTPLPIEFIRKLDGEISFHARTILLANARLVDGKISMVASNGVLAINPIAVTFEDGLIDGSVVLYARDTPGFKGSMDLINFDLGRFLTAAKVTNPFEAHMHFGAQLQGEGETIAAMFANAQGQANLVMGEGRLGPQITDLFGGREAAGLTPVEAKESGEDVIDLTCLVSRFDVDGGIARSRAFLVQTSDSVTTGKGSINLRSESIDLRLAPRPKNPAWLDKAVDLRITGTLVEPIFRADGKKVSKGIAGSLGRFALARRDSDNLLPLIDRSVTSNNPCIVALTGQKVAPKGRSRIYSLTQVQ